MENGPQASLPTQGDPGAQVGPPLLACSGAGQASQRHNLGVLLFLFRRELNEIFDIQNLIRRACAPSHIDLDGIEPKLLQLPDGFARPRNRNGHFRGDRTGNPKKTDFVFQGAALQDGFGKIGCQERTAYRHGQKSDGEEGPQPEKQP